MVKRAPKASWISKLGPCWASDNDLSFWTKNIKASKPQTLKFAQQLLDLVPL